jgi:hypothetical protein
VTWASLARRIVRHSPTPQSQHLTHSFGYGVGVALVNVDVYLDLATVWPALHDPGVCHDASLNPLSSRSPQRALHGDNGQGVGRCS